MKGACNRAYEFVASMPGYKDTYINTKGKAEFLGETYDKPILLEEAFDITLNPLNLSSLKKAPSPIVGYNIFLKYRKKG